MIWEVSFNNNLVYNTTALIYIRIEWYLFNKLKKITNKQAKNIQQLIKSIKEKVFCTYQIQLVLQIQYIQALELNLVGILCQRYRAFPENAIMTIKQITVYRITFNKEATNTILSLKNGLAITLAVVRANLKRWIV